jgi:hypothetical protein
MRSGRRTTARIICSIGDARIEVRCNEIPLLLRGDAGHELANVVIRVVITKCIPHMMKEVLPVDERHSTLDSWLNQLNLIP